MLILEDGSGLPNSNAYANAAMFIAHFTPRKVARALSATVEDIEAALIRATDSLDTEYVYVSAPATSTQALDWPRYEMNGIHAKLIRATLELALIALDTDLFAPPAAKETIQEENTVGSISEKVTYQLRASNDPYPKITKRLEKIATRRGSGVSMHWLST